MLGKKEDTTKNIYSNYTCQYVHVFHFIQVILYIQIHIIIIIIGYACILTKY